MSTFYSVQVGDTLTYKGCSCGYGLYLGDVVKCVEIKLDKFFWINPHTGDKRVTVMGSPCFELVEQIPNEEEVEQAVQVVRESMEQEFPENVIKKQPKPKRKTKTTKK